MGREKMDKELKKESKNIKKQNKKISRQNRKKKHRVIKAIFGILFTLILLAIIALSVFIAGIYYEWWFKDDFAITAEELIISTSNSVIVDSEGNVTSNLSGDEKRQIISLAEMSQYLPSAYIAIEDERFESHNGVDIKRTVYAILTYVTHGGSSSFGGSTITQQLVKNATGEDDDSPIRKIKEWVKAYRVEQIMTKDEILETYLNIIFVGSDVYGVELGAQHYFGKSAADLSLAECAFMAGINHAPNAYNPYGTKDVSEKIKTRTKTVLVKMLELGYINQEEYTAAVEEANNGLNFKQGDTSASVNSYFVDAVIDQVINDIAEKRGISKALAKNYVYGSGVKIYSTEVSSIQDIVEAEFLKSEYIKASSLYEGETTQAAMVVIDHETGYVMAVAGGLGEKTESRGLNRATQSVRQTGSAMKPIAVVGPGLQEGTLTASTVYDDSYTIFQNGNQLYDPRDLGAYKGLITVREAVETSQNIPFVKAMVELTNSKSTEYLKKMGISSLTEKDSGLSLAIGGLNEGISPLEMAAAYACIANKGIYISPTFYTKVEDKNGNEILKVEQTQTRVFSEAVAYVLTDILKEPVYGSAGTATYCKIDQIETACKTGTTNNYYDRWLCGFTPNYTAAVWYGYDQNETMSRSGRNPAGSIWSSVMKQIHSGLPAYSFEMPAGVVKANVCGDTGLLATDKCTNVYSEVYLTGTVPSACDGHIEVTLCTETNLIANEYCKTTQTQTYITRPETETDPAWTTEEKGKYDQITEVCTKHKAPEVKPPVQNNNGGTGNTIGNNTTTNKPTNNTVGNNTNNTTGNTVGNNTTTNKPTNSTTGNNTNSTNGNTVGNNTTTNKPTNSTTGNNTNSTNGNTVGNNTATNKPTNSTTGNNTNSTNGNNTNSNKVTGNNASSGNKVGNNVTSNNTGNKVN